MGFAETYPNRISLELILFDGVTTYRIRASMTVSKKKYIRNFAKIAITSSVRVAVEIFRPAHYLLSS
jgi:hypothetical protein